MLDSDRRWGVSSAEEARFTLDDSDNNFPLQQLIRPGQALFAVTGLRESRVRELVSQGLFPKPIRLTDGGRAIAWLAADLARWQRERIRARDAALVDASLISTGGEVVCDAEPVAADAGRPHPAERAEIEAEAEAEEAA